MATPLEQMIESAMIQVRAELIRLYADGDVGTITLHCGEKQIRVKATPERNNEPVRLETYTQVRPTDTFR